MRFRGSIFENWEVLERECGMWSEKGGRDGVYRREGIRRRVKRGGKWVGASCIKWVLGCALNGYLWGK